LPTAAFSHPALQKDRILPDPEVVAKTLVPERLKADLAAQRNPQPVESQSQAPLVLASNPVTTSSYTLSGGPISTTSADATSQSRLGADVWGATELHGHATCTNLSFCLAGRQWRNRQRAWQSRHTDPAGPAHHKTRSNAQPLGYALGLTSSPFGLLPRTSHHLAAMIAGQGHGGYRRERRDGWDRSCPRTPPRIATGHGSKIDEADAADVQQSDSLTWRLV